MKPKGDLEAVGEKGNGRQVAQGLAKRIDGPGEKDNGRQLAQGLAKRIAGPGEKDNGRQVAPGRSAEESSVDGGGSTKDGPTPKADSVAKKANRPAPGNTLEDELPE